MMNYSTFGRFWNQKIEQWGTSHSLINPISCQESHILHTASGVVLVIDMSQHCTQVMRHSQIPENIATPRQLGVLLGFTSQDNVIPVGSLHLGGCRRLLWHWAKFFTWGGNLVLWSSRTTCSRGSLSWKREKGNKLNNTAGKLWIYAVQNFIVILGPHAT
jgi:hypothetical protein